MKILINALSARQGGGQTYLMNLLQFMPDDFDAEIFILAPDGLDLPLRANVKRIKVDWPVANPYSRAIWERFLLPSLLKKYQINLLFCPGGVIGTSLPKGCLGVTMFRNMIPFDMKQRLRYPLGPARLRNWLLNRVMLRSMIQADLVIFISEWARHVIENLAEQPIKSVVIHHGINPLFRSPQKVADTRPEWLPEGDYLLYVSTLDVYKAQLELIRGYALAHQDTGLKHKLILIGPENHVYGQQVRDEILRLGLTEHVILMGTVKYSELPLVYRHAAVNLFASECENCPNILLEALASGQPVLCSSIPPMPEFGGDAVEYFDPTSPRDFADKITTLLADQSRLNTLAAKALERSNLYDWNATARKTWNALFQAWHERQQQT